MVDRDFDTGQFIEQWPSIEAKFTACTEIRGDCLVWIGTTDKDGYGKFYWKGMHLRAHRVAWEIVHGAIPCALLVCHTCDNPACCRIEHLFTGTPKDNTDDMMNKGRHNGRKADLDSQDIMDIKGFLEEGLSQQDVAFKYGISQQTVSNVKNGIGRFGKVW